MKQYERTLYITPDGIKFNLDAPPKRNLIFEEGLGMPPIEYITSRGPFQHGETFKDYFLRPRNIQMGIRHNFCSRSDYWDGRANLLNHVRPNRIIDSTTQCGDEHTLGKLRKYLANGNIRDIDVLILEGPNFNPRDPRSWDEWAYTETLRWIAFNPIWYDPLQRTQVVTPDSLQLVFPITFPITFGSLDTQFNVTYAGTWYEYPTFTITGPIAGLVITNVTTDETIVLDYTVPAGVTVFICLQYSTKTVISFSSDDAVPRLLGGTVTETNLIGFVTPNSDFGTFHLAPDPEAANGVNTIRVQGTGTSAATRIEMAWYHRYIGV